MKTAAVESHRYRLGFCVTCQTVRSKCVQLDWDESKHPRAAGGKFGTGTGLPSRRELERAHYRRVGEHIDALIAEHGADWLGALLQETKSIGIHASNRRIVSKALDKVRRALRRGFAVLREAKRPLPTAAQLSRLGLPAEFVSSLLVEEAIALRGQLDLEWDESLHPRDETGKFADGGGATKSVSVPVLQKDFGQTRPVVVRVKDVGEAVSRILKGEVIELEEIGTVHTLLEKLSGMAIEAEQRGEEAPQFDLCKVSVSGSNLFCGDKVRTDEFPDGVPRLKMPQLAGSPRAGSDASRLPILNGEVNGARAFMDHLVRDGISTKHETVPAAHLKASQSELVGVKVARIMTQTKFDPAKDPIFVSRDNYVLDGHHRWAAVVGMDAKDGRLGDSKMNVIRVDAPISELLHRANHWTREFGIESKGIKLSYRAKLRLLMLGEWDESLHPRDDAGKFTESSGGGGSGSTGTGTGTGSTSAPTVLRGQAARDRFEVLKTDWAKVNDSLLEDIESGNPDSPAAREKMTQLKSIVKEMYSLEADPGGYEGIGLPGGARDLVVIGAGPGGLAAAVMGGTDGLDTLIIDAETSAGGQAKWSSRIENYPGFPNGTSGEQLAVKMFDQAERVGAQTHLGVRVTNIAYDESTGLKTLTLSDGKTVTTRAVVLAGGIQFRKLEFPGSDSQSVIYGNAKQLAKIVAGKEAVVVGGSNGAAQAALGAARTAKHVTVVSRSPIKKAMSDYQIRALRSHSRITVIEGDEVSSLSGSELKTKKGRTLKADGLGVFVGGGPQTKWLPPSFQREKAGRLRVNGNLETTMPGVFAAGDIRHGAIGRIGAAVGDGQFAAKNVHDYFIRMPGATPAAVTP